MHQQRQQKIHNLEGKIPIKNPHLVQSLHVHNNKQIFVVYNTYIHIHSTQKIGSFLPSLICMIELSEIVKKIDKSSYQDGLSEKIITSDKSKFGEIVFGQDLDTNNNKLVNITYLKERLRYLGGQFLRVRSVDIHNAGHLLVCFEDRRCVFLKRISPFSLSQETSNMYDLTNPILLNSTLHNPIISSIFTGTSLEIHILSFHLSSKQSLDSTISRISIGERDEQQVYSIPEGKRKNIESKGFIKMSYIPNSNSSSSKDKDKDSGHVLLLYFNKVVVVEASKFNAKNKTYQITNQKEVNLSQSLKEHVIDSWNYTIPKPQKELKVYLLTSAAVWQLQLSFKNQSKDSSNLHYTINKRCQHTAKSNVYWINFKGEFMQYVIPLQSQPNYVTNLAVQTENGMLVRLIANGAHYQEGYLYLACPSRPYIVEKSIYNLKSKQNGDKPWVNFGDIAWAKRYPQLKKQLIKQLHQLKVKQKQHSTLPPGLLKFLQFNLHQALDHHLQKTKELKSEIIGQRHTQYNPTHCSISNKKITTQDVYYCEQCQLYSIKQNAQDRCCYICWNVLYSMQ